MSYLLKNGSERVVTSARDHLYDMKPLEEFVFRDDHGKDQGINGESCVLQWLKIADKLSFVWTLM